MLRFLSFRSQNNGQFGNFNCPLFLNLEACGKLEAARFQGPRRTLLYRTSWIRIISTSLGDENVLHIINCETSASVWSNLQSVIKQKSEASVHFLQQSFFSYEKHSDDNV
uniref:Uncharacterized protein n=1 Tax=Megaselia scalaris TaxID=36166 RepID=T1GNL2_MEGSC